MVATSVRVAGVWCNGMYPDVVGVVVDPIERSLGCILKTDRYIIAIYITKEGDSFMPCAALAHICQVHRRVVALINLMPSINGAQVSKGDPELFQVFQWILAC